MSNLPPKYYQNTSSWKSNDDKTVTPKNAHRFRGVGLSDEEIAKQVNDTEWLAANDNTEIEIIAENEEHETISTNQSISSNENRTVVVEAMNNFKVMLDKLHDKFCKNRAIYTMYFKMDLTPSAEIGTIPFIDTTSPDWLTNNLISFTHKMNGSGEANTFTLDILFKPNDRNFKSIKNLEAKLLAACAIYNSKFELKEEGEIYSNCTFQYGYGDDTTMRSPKYYATIMDYDCKLENGNLRYTITGYDGLYSQKEYRIAPKSEYLTTASGQPVNGPMGYIKRIFEVEFKDNKFYNIDFINIDFNKVKFPGEEYKQFSQNNIFQVIKDILAGCMTESEYIAMSGNSDSIMPGPNPIKKFLPNQKQVFGFYIDSQDNSEYKFGTVYIYKLESLYGEENKHKTDNTILPDCGIEFGWFAPTSGAYNHIVKDWHPKFEGSALMALATTYRMGGDQYYTMTDSGNIESVVSLGSTRQGIPDDDIDKAILSTIHEYSDWAFVTQYPYSASMTILGAPCEAPMTGKIKVTAKMGDEIHHSSGVYMILEKTDKINSGGFFTELELYKFAPGYDPKYAIKDDKKSKEEQTNENETYGDAFNEYIENSWINKPKEEQTNEQTNEQTYGEVFNGYIENSWINKRKG